MDGEEWEVEYTDQFFEEGPNLKRPLVGEIVTSRHQNMKELRRKIKGHHLRVIFAFDPRRAAILLLGGDKTGNWRKWYDDEVARADDLYDEHLEELRREGLL